MNLRTKRKDRERAQNGKVVLRWAAAALGMTGVGGCRKIAGHLLKYECSGTEHNVAVIVGASVLEIVNPSVQHV